MVIYLLLLIIIIFNISNTVMIICKVYNNYFIIICCCYLLYNIKTQEEFPTQNVGNFMCNGVSIYILTYIYIALSNLEHPPKK